MSLTGRIERGLKASLGANIVYTASNAVLILLLTRYLLTPGEFGLLQFTLSVLGVIGIFGSLGLPKAAARYVNEYVEKDPTQVRFILRRSTEYVVLLLVVVGTGLALASGIIASLLGVPALGPMILIGVTVIVFSTISSFISAAFQGFNRVEWSAVVTALSGVGRTVFAVGFVLLGFGAAGALMGYTAGWAFAALVGGGVLYTRYYRRYRPTDQPEPGLARRVLKYSVPLAAARGAGVLDNRVDTILVGVLLNPTAVGFYVVARQVTEVVTVPAGSFGYTISPMLGEQKSRNSLATAARLYEESLTYILLFYVPAAAGLALISEPLVRLVFGAAYLSAAPVLQVLCLWVVIHAVNKITSDGLDYLGQARFRAVAMLIMAVSNFILNLFLIPRIGIVGAAIATVITYSAYTLTNVYLIHRELSLRVRKVLRQAGVVCLITFVMAGTVASVLPQISGIVSLFAVVLLGGVVWIILAVLSGLLEVERIAALF